MNDNTSFVPAHDTLNATASKDPMHKLILELLRLYLAPGVKPEQLAPRIAGQAVDAIDLAADDGAVRAIVIPFRKMRAAEDRHWTLLCEVANALQAELDLPAPAVSVSGSDGYGLWLSLADPVPAALAQEFVALLHATYFADVNMAPGDHATVVALPPCLNRETGKWSAFIHPGMGASFADESGLEMAPPLGGQVAFLEGLHSIDAAQFDAALTLLRQRQPASGPAPARTADAGAARRGNPGLLLQDATLEDIVAFLHAKNIEPTFRHLIGPTGTA